MSSTSNKNSEITVLEKEKPKMFIHTKLGSNPGSVFHYLFVNWLWKFSYQLWILVSSQKWCLPHRCAVSIKQDRVKSFISSQPWCFHCVWGYGELSRDSPTPLPLKIDDSKVEAENLDLKPNDFLDMFVILQLFNQWEE